MNFPSLRRKENQAADSNFLARKRPRGTARSKWLCPALTSSYEGYNKNLKTPQNDEIAQKDNRNQER